MDPFVFVEWKKVAEEPCESMNEMMNILMNVMNERILFCIFIDVGKP